MLQNEVSVHKDLNYFEKLTALLGSFYIFTKQQIMKSGQEIIVFIVNEFDFWSVKYVWDWKLHRF